MTHEQLKKWIRVRQDSARINAALSMIQVWAMTEVALLCSHRVPDKKDLPAR